MALKCKTTNKKECRCSIDKKRWSWGADAAYKHKHLQPWSAADDVFLQKMWLHLHLRTARFCCFVFLFSSLCVCLCFALQSCRCLFLCAACASQDHKFYFILHFLFVFGTSVLQVLVFLNFYSTNRCSYYKWCYCRIQVPSGVSFWHRV